MKFLLIRLKKLITIQMLSHSILIKSQKAKLIYHRIEMYLAKNNKEKLRKIQLCKN